MCRLLTCTLGQLVQQGSRDAHTKAQRLSKLNSQQFSSLLHGNTSVGKTLKDEQSKKLHIHITFKF